ncbi:hypothetical protein AGMMS49940_19400 [Spirochaetia bacterium]|nr:hypothetical protein AGMMS49940_19400 [Spirochaetia bacterium]
MAETKALSVNKKRGLLSNPKDLTDLTNQLQAKIELAKRALKQKGIDPKKYNEILEQGQEWARQKLETELNIKEYIEEKSDGRGGDRRSGKFKNPPNEDFDLKKTKIELIQEELGLTKKQQEQISKLTRDGVDEAIENAIEAKEIPTRYSAIKCSNKLKDDKEPEPVKDHKIYITIKSPYHQNKSFILDFGSKDELEYVYDGIEERLKIDVSPYEYVNPPFSYPGGKTKIMDRILPLISMYSDERDIVSPFLGSGAIEINLANKGHNVIGYDYDINIANLWTQILNDNKKLKERIHYFITKRIEPHQEDYKENYKKIRKDYDNGKYTDKIDRAAMWWIIIMTSFGSRVNSNTAGNQYFKSTKHDFVEKKIGIYNGFRTEYKNDGAMPEVINFDFGGRMSFEKSIAKHPYDFLYCDPPYMDVPPDYGESDINHNLLADILKERDNWILSYNDIPKVRKLYDGYNWIELNVPYSLSTSGKEMTMGKELLIIGPITNDGGMRIL